jgi:AcrR family transcriptional regulator
MSEIQKRGRGRPSTFDRPTVLREAMKLFWENGYEGTSFDDLISRMSISPSSFYNAFGSKERLYREAAECFLEDAQKWIQEALWKKGANTRAAFAHLLESAAIEFSRKDLPRGCMISLSGTHQGPDAMPIRDLMVDYRAASESYLAERIRKGIGDGDMSPDVDVDALAAFVHAVVRGMAVQARDGATRARLIEIGRTAMNAWPADIGSPKSSE